MSAGMSRVLPTGVVTFMFTDIEGSTAMLQRLGTGYDRVLADHASLVRAAVAAYGGVEVSTEGDSFFVVFTDAADAVAAAVGVQRALGDRDWPAGGRVTVRVGLHTGEGRLGGDNYVGLDVNRAARISAAGHGGQILLSESTSSRVAGGLEPGAVLVDRGRHRLKGLDDPERIVELQVPDLDMEFPPLRTGGTPTNLPTQPSPFVGRGAEVAELSTLVGPGRLVTVIGPGGVGKTRVALAAAADMLGRFPDGVFLASLEGTANAAEVPAALAHAMGVRPGTTDPVDALAAAIGSSAVLLVIDNFEHVIDAAVNVARLRAGCPQLAVLATSQRVLGLRGEQVLPLAPLTMPTLDTPEAVRASDAGAFFIRAVREFDPSFDVDQWSAPAVEAVVSALDGLPLALELAAARVRLFGLDGLRDELTMSLSALSAGKADAPARHHAIASTVEWSEALLEPPDKAVLHRASVFVDGFTLAAARSVCSSAVGGDASRAVAALVDTSLLRVVLQHGTARYSMLRPIQAYARDRLHASGSRAEAEEAHAQWYLSLACDAAADLRGSRVFVALERLQADHGNLVTALEWSVTLDPDLGRRALPALAQHFGSIGSLGVAQRLATRLLAAPAEDASCELSGLLGAAWIDYWLHDYAAAQNRYEQARTVAEREGDRQRLVEALVGLAHTHHWQGQLDAAQDALDLAHDALAHSDTRGRLELDNLCGILSFTRGDLAAASRKMLAVRQSAQQLGHVDLANQAEGVLAGIAVRLGDHRSAAAAYALLLAQAREVNLDALMVMGLDHASVAVAGLDPVTGARLAGAVNGAVRRRGPGMRTPATPMGTIHEVAGLSLDTVRIASLLTEGEILTLDDAYALFASWAEKNGILPSPIDAAALAAAQAQSQRSP